MFQKLIDDFRESAGGTVRLTSLAAAVAALLFITIGFLCAAAFVYVLQTYGLLEACLAGAGVFFVAALMTAACYVTMRKKQEQLRLRRQAEASKSTMHAALSDPMVLAAGLQIVRTIGLRRIIPLVAVAGIALGLMASRRAAPDDRPAE